MTGSTIGHGAAASVAVLMLAFGVAGCSDDTRSADESAPTTTTTLSPALTPTPVPPTDDAAPDRISIGVVAPSAADDGAWTQAMIDSIGRVMAQREIDVDVTGGISSADDAATALRRYAAAGFDLVIAHGTQFVDTLLVVADEFPATSFAAGTATDVGGRSNVFAYAAAAHESGYVNGVLAAELTRADVIGVVGPVAAGDAAAYVDGFVAGVDAQNPDASVDVLFIDSFDDDVLAGEAASALVADGADVLTGISQMTAGAIGVASADDLPWLGVQADQSALGPDVVVASQVYRWDDALVTMIERIGAGSLGGEALLISYADGGLVTVYDDTIDVELRALGDEVIAGIVDGSIVVAPAG